MFLSLPCPFRRLMIIDLHNFPSFIPLTNLWPSFTFFCFFIHFHQHFKPVIHCFHLLLLSLVCFVNVKFFMLPFLIMNAHHLVLDIISLYFFFFLKMPGLPHILFIVFLTFIDRITSIASSSFLIYAWNCLTLTPHQGDYTFHSSPAIFSLFLITFLNP